MADEKFDIAKIINANLIELHLKGQTKAEVIDELSNLLTEDGDVID